MTSTHPASEFIPGTLRNVTEASEQPRQDETLGEGGKKALDAERAARKTLEKELNTLQEASEQRDREQASEIERLKTELTAERGKLQKLEDKIDVLNLVIKHKLAADDAQHLAAAAKDAREKLANALASR